MFPPTPPPEGEKTELSRGASVRAGTRPTPAKLNIDKARQPQRYEIRDEPSQPPQRRGTQRGSSEPRGPRRQNSTRDRQADNQDELSGDVYDAYSSRNSRSNGRSRQPQYIEEEDGDGSSYEDDNYDDGEFEIMNRPPPRTAQRQASVSRSNTNRRPAEAVRKVRIKVHTAEDVRYIMVGTAIEFPDLVDKIKDKFALRQRFKVKVRDDDAPSGEMITVGDQDDLDMVMMGVRSLAKRERADMGKLEVSAQNA